MGEEEKVSVPQEKSETPFGGADGSDDDGPIGLFLKMKKSRKAKEEKMGLGEGEVKVKKVAQKVKEPAADQKLGGMDDTLANLRKKLRGPKKDNRFVPSASIELSDEVSGKLVNAKSTSKALEIGFVVGDEKSDAVVDSFLAPKRKKKSKKPKTGSPRTVHTESAHDDTECDISGDRLLQIGETDIVCRKRVSKNPSGAAVMKIPSSAVSRKPQSTYIKRSKKNLPNDVTGETVLIEVNPLANGFAIPVSASYENSDGKNFETRLNKPISVSEHKSCSATGTCATTNMKLDVAVEANGWVNETQAQTVEAISSSLVLDKDNETLSKSDTCADDDFLASTVNPMELEYNRVLNGNNLKETIKVNKQMDSPKVVPHECADEEADRGSSPSPNIDQSDSTDALSDLDLKRSSVQRERRNKKKRRHWDMAYEGDADWDTLISAYNYHDRNNGLKTRKREKIGIFFESENGEAAAIAAGLKARKVGPIEKITFKEVLKQKGGLQEYLECRNHILGLWSKDISRILLLSDCGVTDAPSKDEHLLAPLIREVYAFLDRSGFINAGIAIEREKKSPNVTDKNYFIKEKSFLKPLVTSVADMEDCVSFIVDKVEDRKAPMEVKVEYVADDQIHAPNSTRGTSLPTTAEEPVILQECREYLANDHRIQLTKDRKSPRRMLDMYPMTTNSHKETLDQHLDSGPEAIRCPSDVGPTSMNYDVLNHHGDCDSVVRKRVIIIGAGSAGLSAARHLQRQGVSVIILEARSRIGGRVYTDRSSLSVPVDIGASIVTGVEADVDSERRPDPSSLICSQLGLEFSILNSDCPLYDTVTGQKVPSDLDETLEDEYNSLLDDMVLLVAQKGQHVMKMSLEDGLEYVLRKRREAQSGTDIRLFLQKLRGSCFDSAGVGDDCESPANEKSNDDILNPLERRVMNWHFAHLEYGCAALLKDVSLPYWNQDDVYGGFGGAHCMIKGGYSSVVESLAEGLQIRLNQVVTDISYNIPDYPGETGHGPSRVKVFTANGDEFSADAVLVTVPLGCLKAETIKFQPPLPQWKRSSIQRLGYGVLEKVVLEFPKVFWDDSVDYFGATAEETSQRGQCFMFWNLKKTVGAPVLIALLVGEAALKGQSLNSIDHVNHAVGTLRKLFGEDTVPNPVASVVTDWGRDPFSFGAYSYVAIGASGEDYDLLGRPVENCLFFAGEATCKEHPDTVGGAMMSGIREAVRILDIFTTGDDHTAEVEALEAAQRHSDTERVEVRDIKKRLEAVDLSNALYESSFDGTQILTREALLRDLFSNVKTTAGRLHLAKVLLTLPAEKLRTFAGTQQGLTILNSWMLDSMGKDGTQLLRHCVRILVLVSTNLLAVRLSGIGRTVKEKVCVHTSRDIRAIASQLVSVWLDIFRKEKASNGGLQLLKQTANASKSRSLKGVASGKPPLRTHQGTPESSLMVKSTGCRVHPNANNKKLNSKMIKMENESKSDILSSRSDSSTVRLEIKDEEETYVMSEEEQAVLAAAEAARAAARAAAEAYASSSVKSSVLLPKIPSFHKFARREQYAQMDESEFRKKWSGGVLGRQDCYAEIDSRNCRVRDWSADFSAACHNIDSSAISVNKADYHSQSNNNAYHMNFREHSGESAAPNRNLFTKAWVDGGDSEGLKDFHAIERWQSQAAAADAHFYQQAMHEKDEDGSNATSRLVPEKNEGMANESSVSHLTTNKHLDNRAKGAEQMKQAVVDYVASLLMPLYKARKIDREGYKTIMKKTAAKVMEQTSDAEKAMSVHEFLDFKRKNKIRAFVDTLIERHMSVKSAGNY
uniref:SWIRM domain-containing protein n=1 Tax=Kalanchoe fedtschenkoi TaxID=63787 RepID=A0A7N0V2Y8_KALFE